ncbi:MAG: tetratricopeptide repeat protein, partial [Deltaproteobacteria bacterium]|nr:tetratricopeptide repeat protein [Deltaproteobacteria bacterium]
MRRHRSEIIVSLFLVIITVAVYWQVRNHEFINYDDDDYVTENNYVQAGWTWEGVSRAFTSKLHGHWHPVTWLSHMTDCQLFGLNPAGHHLTSLFLHIAKERTTGALFRSAFVAALFAIHPLHVESVAWVADRKDVLSTFFWMMAMWAYVRYAEHPGFSRYLLTLVAFIVGLMAKPMVVTLPFILLLMDYWPLRRFQFGQPKMEGNAQNRGSLNSKYQSTSLRRLVLEKVLFLIVVGIFVILLLFARQHMHDHQVGLVAQESGAVVLSLRDFLPRPEQIAQALLTYISYIGKMFWPLGLATPYSRDMIYVVQNWQVVGAGLLLLGISFFVVWRGRRDPYLLVGWLWYLVAILPVIGFVRLGPHLMADRYTYLPLIGLFIMIAWGVPDLVAKWRYRRLVLGISTGIVVLGLTVCTWLQVRHWKSSVTLFEHVVSVTADNWLAHNNLGSGLEKEERYDEAMVHYLEALRIKPHHAKVYNNLGIVCIKQGKVKEAFGYFSEAIRLKPDYAEAHHNLGAAFIEQGKVEEAISHYFEALRIKPDYAEAHDKLGTAFYRQGNLDEAISHYSEALQMKPNYPEAHYNLGVVFAKQGRVREAISRFSDAIRIKPDYAEAHFNLGVAFAEQGKLKEAMSHFSEALRVKPDYAEAHHSMGAIVEAKGRLDEAISHYSEVLRIKPDYPEMHFKLAAVFTKQGRLDEAISHYAGTLPIKPDHAEAHNKLGIALAKH